MSHLLPEFDLDAPRAGPPRRTSRRRAVTLVELTVVTPLFVLVVGIAVQFLRETSDAVEAGISTSYVDGNARRVLDSMVAELKDSGTSRVEEVPTGKTSICYTNPHGRQITLAVRPLVAAFLVLFPSVTEGECGGLSVSEELVESHPIWEATSGPSVSFRKRVGFEGTTADWSTVIAYSLRSSSGETAGNGVDDDGDGVIDEKDLVRTQDGETIVLAHGVTELDFTRAEGENSITVTICLARRTTDPSQPVERRRSTIVAFRNKPETRE